MYVVRVKGSREPIGFYESEADAWMAYEDLQRDKESKYDLVEEGRIKWQ